MPFTPLHFGPSSWLGFGFFKKIYVPAIFIGSIIIDVEPIIVILFNLNYPLHGNLHTYFGAILMGLATWLICIVFRPLITSFMNLFSLQQEPNHSSIALGSFIGTFSHVFLDSFLYSEMHPFFPILGNPFLGMLSSGGNLWILLGFIHSRPCVIGLSNSASEACGFAQAIASYLLLAKKDHAQFFGY